MFNYLKNCIVLSALVKMNYGYLFFLSLKYQGDFLSAIGVALLYTVLT